MMESRGLQPEEEEQGAPEALPVQSGLDGGQALQNVPSQFGQAKGVAAGHGGDGFPRAENAVQPTGQRPETANGFPNKMAAPEVKEDPIAAEGRESYERFYEAVKLIGQSSNKPILSIAEFEQLRAASSAQNPVDGYGMFILGAVANMSERLDQGFQVENPEAGGMLYAALSQAEVFFRDLRRQNGQKFIEIAYRMYPDIFRNFGNQLTPADVKFIENTVFGAFRKLRTNLDRLVGEGQEAAGAGGSDGAGESNVVPLAGEPQDVRSAGNVDVQRLAA